MRIPPGAELRVDGELTAEVGGLSTRLAASGDTIVWHVADPAVALGSLPGGGRRSLGRAADALAAMGLALEVRDEQGLLLRAGSDTRSVIGRLVSGSEAVRLRRLLTWWRLRRVVAD